MAIIMFILPVFYFFLPWTYKRICIKHEWTYFKCVLIIMLKSSFPLILFPPQLLSNVIVYLKTLIPWTFKSSIDCQSVYLKTLMSLGMADWGSDNMLHPLLCISPLPCFSPLSWLMQNLCLLWTYNISVVIVRLIGEVTICFIPFFPPLFTHQHHEDEFQYLMV